MCSTSRYWTICQISPGSEGVGYKNCLVSIAQEFVQQDYGCQNGDVQAALLSHFHGNSNSDATTRALSGLCLRCSISNSILNACKEIAYVFGADKQFIYQDLLPFVLDDDGKNLIIVDNDGKTQLILDENGETRTTTYNLFSVKVLQSYKHNSQSRMSLDSWARLQTKQHPELKAFLSEFGFQAHSDWALLNRAKLTQLERLSGCDRTTVEVFHQVYRRDRRLQQRLARVTRCPDPSTAQLQEMLNKLQARGIIINTTIELLEKLKHVATQLRQYDIWSYREPLDIYEPDTENYTPRPDLPHSSLNEAILEQQEILEFLHQQLSLALATAIAQKIGDRITTLQNSNKYATFAQKFLTGLQLYYCHGLSLREIAPQLEMTNWYQARRVLNPGELLKLVCNMTVQQLFDRMLQKARELGLTTIITEPDYLQTLEEQIKTFVDEEIFIEAAAEIKAGQNRSLDSFYAQQLRFYLENYIRKGVK